MSIEPMSEERFNWLREYLAPLPRNVAPLTQECLDEIDRLRAENAQLRADVQGLFNTLDGSVKDIAKLKAENEKLRAELSHAKWNLDKAGLVIAQQCAKLGNQDRKLEKLRAELQ